MTPEWRWCSEQLKFTTWKELAFSDVTITLAPPALRIMAHNTTSPLRLVIPKVGEALESPAKRFLRCHSFVDLQVMARCCDKVSFPMNFTS
jgi:hypothetical protein